MKNKEREANAMLTFMHTTTDVLCTDPQAQNIKKNSSHLAPSMGQLNAEFRSLSMNKVGDLLDLVDVIVRPNARILGTDTTSTKSHTH